MDGRKMLLPFGESTVAGKALQALLSSQVEEVVVVLGHEAKIVREHLQSVSQDLEPETRNLKFAVNSRYREGMFSSVLCGLEAANPAADVFLISLADMPSVTSQVVDFLITEFSKANKGIVVPTYQGQRGHPLLFQGRYKEEVIRLDPEIGLQGLLSLHPEDILEVPVTCSGVVKDIDHWEDYSAQQP